MSIDMLNRVLAGFPHETVHARLLEPERCMISNLLPDCGRSGDVHGMPARWKGHPSGKSLVKRRA